MAYWALGGLLALFASMLPSSALARSGSAGRHALRLEGAGALMVGAQADRFNFGGGAGASYEYRFIDALGVEARYAAFFFPEPDADPPYGAYQGAGAALRFHLIPAVKLVDLWISGGANAVFTGELSRVGFEVGAGFELAVARRVRFGPFVRYAHVFQPPENAHGPEDGGFLQFGLSLALVVGRIAGIEEGEVAQAAAVCAEDEVPAEPEIAHEERPASEGELLPERILFRHNNVQLSDRAKAEIEAIVWKIKAHPEWERIVIEGHASDVGDRGYNMRLSEQRAEQIRAALIRGGIPASRLEIEAYGHTQPEIPGDTDEVRARNRRVTVRVFSSP